jgi:hypothetical protein
MAQIGVDIIRESNAHKDAVNNGNDINSPGTDVGQKDHDD